ncbi:MAG: creatininase family protein [Anaerolineae bacterium]
MLFEDLNWMDVERYLERDDRVVVVTGACEQHGYLSLLADVRVPLAVAQEACRREGVLVAPPLPYGISPYFTAYPGTLSLSTETFVAVVRELIEGLLAQGFRRVLVSNGHGGNTGLLYPLLVELGNAHPDDRLALFHWWRHPAVDAVAQEAGLPQHHANWSENFPFTRVGPVPEGEKESVEIPGTAPAADFRAALGDGSFGGPYLTRSHTRSPRANQQHRDRKTPVGCRR